MVERRTVYSNPEAFEPDPIYTEDEFGQVAGLVEGEEFTRFIEISTPTGNTLRLPQRRKVEVVVMTDAGGNKWCQPYDPELHGEKDGLTVIRYDEFENNPDFYSAQESFNRVRKAGASKPTGYIDDIRKANGADVGFVIPREVYQRHKMK